MVGFFTVLGFLGKLVNPLSAIAKELAGAYAEKQNAKTAQKRIESDERISAIKARQAVLIAESRHPWNSIIRALIATPVIVILWKIFIWDKVLRLGITDSLSPRLWDIIMMVLAFYFLTSMVDRWRR